MAIINHTKTLHKNGYYWYLKHGKFKHQFTYFTLKMKSKKNNTAKGNKK